MASWVDLSGFQGLLYKIENYMFCENHNTIKDAHTHTHTHLQETEPANLEIDEITTDISLSTGTSPTTL